MRADINTIARKSGVSKATVSRVFTGKKSVSLELREKILKVARELNYAPQQVAAYEVIAIIVYSLDEIKGADGFRTILLVNLIAEITNSNFLVNIVEAKDIDKILNIYTKAAVILLNDKEVAEYKDKISNMKIPRIAIGNIIDGCHSISSDYYGEIASAVEYLIENGHKKISMILDNSTVRAGQERLCGYNETMKKYGLAPMVTYSCHHDISLIEIIANMRKDEPTAVIISGESIANESAYALNLLQVRVPEDLSVISFEKRDSSRWFSPPHTTIDQNACEMVKESIQFIKKIIHGSSQEKLCTLLPYKFNFRSSVKNINIK